MPDQPSTSGGIAERATALLAALGDHEDQVAASLHAAGITGLQDNCSNCPIAVYLLRSDLVPTLVEVGEDQAQLIYGTGADRQNDGDDFINVELPEPVKRFIASFDNDGYLDLVAGGAR
jgi:hypothetical protein